MKKEISIKNQVKDTDISFEMEEFITELREKVEHDNDNREAWKKKLVISNNQREGKKRVTNRPYPGAPNIPLPETDKLIMKKKPNFVLSAYLAKKKALVRVAEGIEDNELLQEKAKKAELGINFVLNKKIDLLKTFTLAADIFLEKGHVIFKVIEKFKRSVEHKVIELKDIRKEDLRRLRRMKNVQLGDFIAERYGLDIEDEEDLDIIEDVIKQFRSKKKVIEFDIEKIESYPDIIVRAPERVTPPAYATDIETVERLTDEYYLTLRELEEGAEDGAYRKSVIKNIVENGQKGKGRSSSDDDTIELNKDSNEGITEYSYDELYKIQEISCWHKKKGDKRYKRLVITLLADIGAIEESILSVIEYPYDELDTWNFVKHDGEIKDARWHAARGIPEQIRAIQEFMEKAINNMIIRDEINNAPVYTVLGGSGIQGNSVRFIPGQKVNVKSHGDIQRLDEGHRVDVSSERMLQILKAYAEESQSSTDQLFRNATNKGGGKTLGEVNQGMQAVSGPINMEVLSWFATLQKLYTMVFKLMRERLGDSIFIEGMEITKEDFNFEADVIPNGSIDLANESVRIGKAMARLQLSLQLPPTIILPEDQYNAARDYFEADGVRDPDKYITRPEEVAKMMREQAMAADAVLQKEEAGIAKEISNLREQGGVMAEGGNGEQR